MAKQDSPIVFLDSGVVIELGIIRDLRNKQQANIPHKFTGYTTYQPITDSLIVEELIRLNKTNLDLIQSEALLKLYDKIVSNEVVVCVPPMVYRETMLDSKSHKLTRDFVTESCFVALPNEPIDEFAYKTATLASMLRDHVDSLKPDVRQDNSGKIEDVNIEDRIIKAQMTIMAYDSRAAFRLVSSKHMFLSTSQLTDDAQNKNEMDILNQINTTTKAIHEREYQKSDSVTDSTVDIRGIPYAPQDNNYYDTYAQIYEEENIYSPQENSDRIYGVNINSEDFGTRAGYNGSISGGHTEMAQKIESYNDIIDATNAYSMQTTGTQIYENGVDPLNMSPEELIEQLD